MFSFTSIHRVSAPRRFSRSGGLALTVLFCLSLALFAGCKMGGDDFVDDNQLNGSLVGTWASTHGDSYAITANHITYAFGTTTNYGGAIEYISNFSDSSGVIIIKYDATNKPVYNAEFDPVTFEPIGDPLPLKGDYVGIYFKELKPGVSVKIGGAYREGGAEAATLEEAKAAFTAGNEGSYMTSYGTYEKQKS